MTLSLQSIFQRTLPFTKGLHVFILVFAGSFAVLRWWGEFPERYSFVLGLLFALAFDHFQRRTKASLQQLASIAKFMELQRKSNCVVELEIGVEMVLHHESVKRLFDKLREKGIVKDGTTKDEWCFLLLQNYRRKYDNESAIEKVKFNIKNNLIGKNGVIDFNDSIFHELFIPYRYGLDEEEARSYMISRINLGLTIRTIMVNGSIKLQIGEFSKEVSPEVIKKGLTVYKTHETVTSFPVLYFSYRSRIPENYLNLSMYATESYYKHQKGEKTDLARDWREITQEAADYNYVCSVADEYVGNRRRWDGIIKRFDEKRKAWLEREQFQNPYANGKDDDYYAHWG